MHLPLACTVDEEDCSLSAETSPRSGYLERSYADHRMSLVSRSAVDAMDGASKSTGAAWQERQNARLELLPPT